MDYTTLLTAALKHTIICRKLWKISPFSIVIDLWKCGVCVCVPVCVYIHNSERFDCLYFKDFADFHPKV